MRRAVGIAWFVFACGSPRDGVAPPRPAQPEPARPTPRLGVFGKPVPYRIVAIPPDGRWAITCEARTDTYPDDGALRVYYEQHGDEGGDELHAYLYDLRGRDARIDGVLGFDPQGRWLAVIENEQPVVIDTVSWKKQPVKATLPRFRLASGRHDWDFDPTGHRALYFRDGALIARVLATGAETVVAATAWRARWTADGAWIAYETLDADTNGDGHLVGPNLRASSMGFTACGVPFDWGMLADDFGRMDSKAMKKLVDNPDTITPRLWRARDERMVDGEAAVDDATVITRAADGSLQIGPVSGRAIELAPVTCQRSEVRAVYPAARTALIVCRPDDKTSVVWWARAGARKELFVVPGKHVAVDGAGGRFVGVLPDHGVIDMETGNVVARGEHVSYRWSDANRLVLRLDEPSRVEVRWLDGRRIEFPIDDDVWDSTIAPPYLLYGATRAHLDTGTLRAIPQPPVSVRTDGAVLLDGGEQQLNPGQHGPRVGPLRWMMP